MSACAGLNIVGFLAILVGLYRTVNYYKWLTFRVQFFHTYAVARPVKFFEDVSSVNRHFVEAF